MTKDVSVFYQANQMCMLYIPQIVEWYRSQSFFTASKRIKALIQNLNLVVTQLSREDQKEEFLLILETVLQAQQRQDYVFLADVLEGDLLPLLQRLQIETLQTIEPDYPLFWEANLYALRQKDPKLAERLDRLPDENPDIWIVPAVNGQPTLKYQKDGQEFYMHSSVNPGREAELFARKYIRQGGYAYTVFGMGLGYPVREILEASKLNHVKVLECKLPVLKQALRYQDLAGYFLDDRLEILYEEDPERLLLRAEGLADAQMLIHYPSLGYQEAGVGREALENYFISSNAILEQGKVLEENFMRLQKMGLPECGRIGRRFVGKDAALVAGGPSLDRELPALKKYRQDITTLTVGTSARKLLEYGIVPDAIVISDSQDTMYRQIEGLHTENIPLLLLSTASADVACRYNGDVYLVYQEGYKLAEQAAEAGGYHKFQTGGSVATLALDILLHFQAKRIMLVGTDFAYTNQQSHANGLGRSTAGDAHLRNVEAVDGTMVETARNLDIYRRWIEKRISQAVDIPIYNTAHGAKIHGTIEKRLEAVLSESDQALVAENR